MTKFDSRAEDWEFNCNAEFVVFGKVPDYLTVFFEDNYYRVENSRDNTTHKFWYRTDLLVYVVENSDVDFFRTK